MIINLVLKFRFQLIFIESNGTGILNYIKIIIKESICPFSAFISSVVLQFPLAVLGVVFWSFSMPEFHL